MGEIESVTLQLQWCLTFSLLANPDLMSHGFLPGENGSEAGKLQVVTGEFAISALKSHTLQIPDRIWGYNTEFVG